MAEEISQLEEMRSLVEEYKKNWVQPWRKLNLIEKMKITKTQKSSRNFIAYKELRSPQVVVLKRKRGFIEAFRDGDSVTIALSFGKLCRGRSQIINSMHRVNKVHKNADIYSSGTHK